jgi:Ni,Fe-hydrogenase III large subunit
MTMNRKLEATILELKKKLYPEFSWDNPLDVFKKESVMVNETFDSKRFIEDYNERIEGLRKEREEIEEQYGEGSRVEPKWGYDLWISTIEGETSDLHQHSYTILELRNVIEAMWEDVDDEEFHELEIPWEMDELQDLYRRFYENIHSKELDYVPMYWQYA